MTRPNDNGFHAPTRRELLRAAAAAGIALPLAGPLARVAAAGPRIESYDDTSPGIPGGIEGDPERVIIVGAGWAGLTLANALRNAGVDHVLLEARDRIGGRAYTADLGGVPIDLGCSFIHEPIGNPMARFADQAGVGRLSANVELDLAILRMYDAYLGRELNAVEKTAALGHGVYFQGFEAAGLASQLGPGASVRDGAQVYLDGKGLTGDARRQAEYTIRSLSEFVGNHEWERLSLYHWAHWDSPYTGVGQGEFPSGGYQRLLSAMAGSEEVRLRHRVHTIERSKRGVRVHAVAKGRQGKKRVTLRGSHVVVAVPLGVLKKGSIRFEPRLPPAKRATIKRAGFGCIEKVALVFDEPFWSDPLHTHIFNVAKPGPLEFPTWLDLDRISGVPALVTLSGGGFARQLSALKAEEARDLALSRLTDILGRAIPAPRAWAATDWLGDPFTRGGYTSMVLGSAPSDLDALAAPVGGRVLFAGESTHSVRYAHSDGAMSSGVREAKRLLRRPDVGLSAG